jgi:hypothetical protein
MSGLPRITDIPDRQLRAKLGSVSPCEPKAAVPSATDDGSGFVDWRFGGPQLLGRGLAASALAEAARNGY